MVLITGENIFLRSAKISDAEKILTWENDGGNKQYNTNKKKLTRPELVNWITSKQHDLELEKELRLIICNTKDNVIGCIDLFELHKKTAGIGIIIDSNFRRKGYAMQAINLLKNYRFKNIALDFLWCNIHPINSISLALFKKCLFVETKNKALIKSKLPNYLFFEYKL